MNIFHLFKQNAETNPNINPFEHFAANVAYMLRLHGFEIEIEADKMSIKHEAVTIAEGATLHDTLASLIMDGVHLRMREQTIKLLEE